MSLDTAQHEAAHAVVAADLGYGVRTLQMHDAGGGITKLANGTNPTPDDAATIAAAGYEAARIRLQQSSGDRGYVEELRGAGSDLERMRREIPGDDDDARERRGEAMDRAYYILRRRWDDVEALADLLHHRRTLDGDEVAGVLRLASPPPRHPVRSGEAPRPHADRLRTAMTCIKEHVGLDGRRWLEGGYIVAGHREVLAHPDCFGPWPGRPS